MMKVTKKIKESQREKIFYIHFGDYFWEVIVRSTSERCISVGNLIFFNFLLRYRHIYSKTMISHKTLKPNSGYVYVDFKNA